MSKDKMVVIRDGNVYKELVGTMTPQEAKKIIVLTRGDAKSILRLNKAMEELYDVLIEALEKRIPQKVVAHTRCPSCGEDVIGSGYYCWNCGQRLEW